MRNLTLWLYLGGTLAVIAATLIQHNQIAELVRAAEQPAVEIVTVGITAHTPGLDFEAWAGVYKYEAPHVPDAAKTYVLDDIIECKEGYLPVAAWTEAHTSWPDPAVMYSVNATVNDEEVQLTLRSRQPGDWGNRGYAYIDVLLLCRVKFR